MSTKTEPKLIKKHNHDHYWIDNGWLFESYKTIRGIRFTNILQVQGMNDMDRCNEACINYIEKEYLEDE